MSAVKRPSQVSHDPLPGATGPASVPSAVRAELQENVLEWLSRARTWTATELPALNMTLLHDPERVGDMATQLRAVMHEIEELPPARLAQLSPPLAREVLKVLGFGACSIERHAQARGDEPGAGLALVPGLEDALAAVSTSAALPPTLGYSGYWTSNTEHPLTFTGDPQEAYFRDQVVAIDDLHSEAAALLRPIAAGELALGDPATAERLSAAAETQVAVHDRYASFRTVGRAAREHFTVPFFRDVMRTFLVAFPVHGKTFHGPNAANIASQAAVDYIVGIVEPFYAEHVRERMTYMSEEERARVVADMTAPSILERLLDALDLLPPATLSVSLRELTRRISTKPELVPALTGFARFRKAAGAAAGAHFGLIVHYLVKSHGADPSAPVGAAHGTGGRTHEETDRVRRMRQREPVSGALVAALRELRELETPS